MNNLKLSLFFVGPLPPPVHGFSEINRRMLLLLNETHKVFTFNVAPSGSVLSLLKSYLSFICNALYHKPTAVYLALSGGKRQWIDMVFLLISRLMGMDIFIHHHSFAYLNNKKLSALLCFRIAGCCKHIVLCSCMGGKLVEKYAVCNANLRVLSNVAFLEDIDVPKQTKSLSGALRIGFLSNITSEKGIFEFFSVLQESLKVELVLEGVIAGPIDPSISKSFASRLSACVNVKYIGPVYGADKKSFFSNIDILFFPTRYSNEAEPVTILEAMGHGVPVIAFDRGCISGMVSDSAGQVFTYSALFVKHTIAAIRPLAESSLGLANARLAARCSFEAGLSSNKALLDVLISEMGGSSLIQPVSS